MNEYTVLKVQQVDIKYYICNIVAQKIYNIKLVMFSLKLWLLEYFPLLENREQETAILNNLMGMLYFEM